MVSFAFPRVNRAGPRACQRPPWTPEPNRGRRKIVRERADQAAVPGVAPAPSAGLSASCLLTQLACRALGRPGECLRCPPTMTKRAELARAPTSPPQHPGPWSGARRPHAAR